METFTIRIKRAFNGFSYAIDDENGITQFAASAYSFPTRKRAIREAKTYISEVLDFRKACDLESATLITDYNLVQQILKDIGCSQADKGGICSLLVFVDNADYGDVYGSFKSAPRLMSNFGICARQK